MDPSSIITWLQTAEDFSTTTSIAILAGILRYALVPLVKKYAEKYLDKEIQGVVTIGVVVLGAFLLMLGVSLIRHIPINVGGFISASVVVALAALGIHGGEKTVQKAQENGSEDFQQITESPLGASPSVQYVDEPPALPPAPEATTLLPAGSKPLTLMFVNGTWVVTEALPDAVLGTLYTLPRYIPPKN